MLLFIVLGLIAKLLLVSWACENETSPLTDFDWSRVGIRRGWSSGGKCNVEGIS
jgi:hypothetical protein